jgi:hypothetical protein
MENIPCKCAENLVNTMMSLMTAYEVLEAAQTGYDNTILLEQEGYDELLATYRENKEKSLHKEDFERMLEIMKQQKEKRTPEKVINEVVENIHTLQNECGLKLSAPMIKGHGDVERILDAFTYLIKDKQYSTATIELDYLIDGIAGGAINMCKE